MSVVLAIHPGHAVMDDAPLTWGRLRMMLVYSLTSGDETPYAIPLDRDGDKALMWVLDPGCILAPDNLAATWLMVEHWNGDTFALVRAGFRAGIPVRGSAVVTGPWPDEGPAGDAPMWAIEAVMGAPSD